MQVKGCRRAIRKIIKKENSSGKDNDEDGPEEQHQEKNIDNGQAVN